MNINEAMTALKNKFPESVIYSDTFIAINTNKIIDRIYCDKKLAFKGKNNNVHPCNEFRKVF